MDLINIVKNIRKELVVQYVLFAFARGYPRFSERERERDQKRKRKYILNDDIGRNLSNTSSVVSKKLL